MLELVRVASGLSKDEITCKCSLYSVHAMLQIGNQNALRIKTQKQSLVPAKALILIGIVVRGVVQSQSEILGIGEQMAQVY